MPLGGFYNLPQKSRKKRSRLMNTQTEKENKSKWLILLLLLISLIALGITLWALFFRDNSPALTPDYAPVETEGNAETIPDDKGSKLESPDGGGSVSISYSTNVSIDLSEKTASLYFANPGKSNQDMVVQVVIQDTILVQSGTLQPGKQVTTLNLLDGAEKQLSPGGYDGKLVILFYDEVTGEKAVVNTEIPVTITVTA